MTEPPPRRGRHGRGHGPGHHHGHHHPRRPRVRRFYWRILFAFVMLLALTGLGTAVLATSPLSGVQGLLVGLGVMALVGLTTRAIARALSRPIEQITEASRRFGGGDLSYRVPMPEGARFWQRRRRRKRRPDGPLDEVFALGSAWNEMADRIEGLVRGQKELLANVSHELRSPLARMRVALELVPRTPENEARLASIEGEFDDLERLVDDVLTTARLDATGVPSRLDQVELAPLLAEIESRARAEPRFAGFDLQVVSRRAPKSVLVDGALLRRALWNLVDNAGKHGASPIVISAERVADELVLAVTDAGPGVGDADRERLFEPFHRGGRARAEVDGYGLGLALARRVAEVHGGSIAAPAVASGFRVELRLPLEL